MSSPNWGVLYHPRGCTNITGRITGSVPTQSLHSNRTSAQGAPVHMSPTAPASHALRLRLRTGLLPQDGLSRPASRHASDQVYLQEQTFIVFTSVLKLYFEDYINFW